MAKAIIVYDTVYNNTELMAKGIEKGLKEAGRPCSSISTLR
jgi:flavodoxin